MAIDTKLVCFNTYSGFQEQLEAGNINEYSIVFIKDTQSIYTRGTFFSTKKDTEDLIDSKQDVIQAGDNISIGEDGVTISADDTTYTFEVDSDILTITSSGGDVTTIDLTPYLNATDTTLSTETQYLVGATTQGEGVRTNTSGVYVQDGEVYNKAKQQLATVESVEAVKNSLEELRCELEGISVVNSNYCFMTRVYENASCAADETHWYGSQENMKKIASHFRMAAIRNDVTGKTTTSYTLEGIVYKFLDTLRITQDEDGNEVLIDGSDGDICVATDTKMYLYAEKITATDGVYEIIGIGTVPMTLFGKDAIGYEPFALSADCCVTSKLTNLCENLPVDKVRSQLNCIYNESCTDGQYVAPKAIFKTTYKSNGGGYALRKISALTNLWHAQAKNAYQTENTYYTAFYYRFIEMLFISAMCEAGTRYIDSKDRLGKGVSCADVTTADTFADEAMTADTGIKYITSDGTVLGYSNIYQGQKLYYSGTTYAAYGLDQTSYGGSFIPMLLDVRVIDGIQANGNIGYINSGHDTDSGYYVFTEKGTIHEGAYTGLIGEGLTLDEEGNLLASDEETGYTMTTSTEDDTTTYTVKDGDGEELNVQVTESDGTYTIYQWEGVDLNTGAGMEDAVRYFTVRDCPGMQSFSDGVMTGVLNVYIKQTPVDNVKFGSSSSGTDLSGGKIIFKFSTSVYRGFTWTSGQAIWMDGFHYVIHGCNSNNPVGDYKNTSEFVTAIYQRDPTKLGPLTVSAGGSDVNYCKEGETCLWLDRGFEHEWFEDFQGEGYAGLTYANGYGKGCNPSVSLFCYDSFGGSLGTYANGITFRGATISGKDAYGYIDINGSAFGCPSGVSTLSPCSLYGYDSVQCSDIYCGGGFSIVNYQNL